jgi:uncharacterized membrane protein YkvA (DUF1232 family)
MKKILKDFQRELKIYQFVLRDARTPKWSKWLLAIAIGYAVSPIDLIPDFIPILGHLDDIIIVPVLVWLAIRMIPKKVIDDCRRQVKSL